MATIKELKEKMLTAVGEIDLSKLTLYDLSTVSNIVKTISDTDDEKFSTAKYYDKLLEKFSQSTKTTYNSTIADLKEGE